MTKVGQSFFRHVEGLVFGEDPRQGYVDAGVFYHPQLGFSFPIPTGFQLYNMPTQVVMIPEDQQAIVLMQLESKQTLNALGMHPKPTPPEGVQGR